MDDAARQAALRRHYEYVGDDQERAHEIYHDDAILEFPQSQERFEGKANFIVWRKIYPAAVELNVWRLRGQGTIWVVESSIRYDGGPWHSAYSIHEFRGDKVARETIYIAEGWEAPEWRAPWRAAWQEEVVG